jgi:putative ABC transport system permease protein
MSVIWHKVWSDLWHNKARTTLAVLSIAVGVFSIGAIFGMVDQLLSGMDAAHQATFPSHLNMYLTDHIDHNTAQRLKNIEGVEDIEVMNSVSVRYKLHPDDEWSTGLIDMRDDFEDPKYDVLQLKEGQWPEKNHIAIERLSSQHFGIDIGDEVIFELDKTDRALPITGKIRHPFVEPPQFGGDAVFIFEARGLERFNIPAGEFDNLRVQVRPYSLALAQEVASEIKSRLAKEDIGVAITFFQDPNKHWGRMFMEGVNLVLQILAVISLFMSMILVVNTLTALITQQIDQIGIIKAVGGRTGTIVKIYLTGVLIYGLLALAISLPLGAYLAWAMSRWWLNIFNIDYETFQFSTRAVVLQVIAAIIVPLLAALWPVLSGAAISVRQAIASYGLGSGKFGGSWLDRAVEKTGRRFLSSPYAVALGNMFRRKSRLILTQLVLIVAGTMFLAVMSLSNSLSYSLANDMGRRGFDIRLGFDEAQRIDRAVKMAQAVPGVAAAEVWFTHPASVLREGQRTKDVGVGSQINGIPLGSQMFTPLLIAGRWLQPGDERMIVISQNMAEDNGYHVGDTMTLDFGELGDADWQVVGIFQTFFNGGFDADPIYAPQPAVFTATKKYNEGARLLVRTKNHDSAEVQAINTQLKTLYENRQMDVNAFDSGLTITDIQDAETSFATVLSMLLAIAVIVALVGGIGLMGSLSISVVERTREIGVMRAIGAQSRTIMGMFVMEGILQGLISWAIAVPISFALGQPMAGALGQAMFDANLDYSYNLTAVGIWLGIIVVIAVIASILPARNATRISVRESLAYA